MDENNRVLIVDDNESIHEDYKKILCRSNENTSEIDDLESALFDDGNKVNKKVSFIYELEDAFSGEEALEKVNNAIVKEHPFALAFVDQRMPPGWSGVETIRKIWEVDPYIEIVICTAYSDYSWDEIISELGITDRLLILKKPFDSVEVKQIAAALIKKWNLADKTRRYEKELKREISISKERLSIIEKQNEILEMEIEMAKKVQMSLLPHKLPEIPKATIAFKYEAMMGVGGDFIDVYYKEGSNRLGLFICDVVGHGISAAFLASMAKMALNNWGDQIDDPVAALETMRELLFDSLGDKFLTACMASLDLNTGKFIFVNAGHPPIMIVRKNNDLEIIKTPGKLISNFIEPKLEMQEIVLKKGDKVILYTDGISEAEDKNGVMLGVESNEKLGNWFKENVDLKKDPESICNSTYKGVIKYIGNTHLTDDFTILVLEYKG